MKSLRNAYDQLEVAHEYDEDGSTGYPKEELRCALDDFLQDHEISEMMEIVVDAIQHKEYLSK